MRDASQTRDQSFQPRGQCQVGLLDKKESDDSDMLLSVRRQISHSTHTMTAETIESLRAERDHWKAQHRQLAAKWRESLMAASRWMTAYHDMRRKAELCYSTVMEQCDTIARMAKLHAELASSGGGGRGDGDDGGGGAVGATAESTPVDEPAETEDEEDEQDDGEDNETVEQGCLLTTAHSE